jgi:hypothetical protein
MNHVVKASAAGFFNPLTYDDTKETEYLRVFFAVQRYLSVRKQKAYLLNFALAALEYLASVINLHESTKEQHGQAVQNLNDTYRNLFYSLIEADKPAASKRDVPVTSELQTAIDLYNYLFNDGDMPT